MGQYVRVNGYTFGLDKQYSDGAGITFVIPGTESYLDIKMAFKNNTGDIEILYEDKVMQTFTGYTLLKSIFDNMSDYTVIVGKDYDDAEALMIIVEEIPSVTEAKAFRASIEAMATNVPDEEAEKDIWAFPSWAYPVTYAVGDRVKYNGILYKCVQAHTSQAEWPPDVVPALFVRIGDPTEEWPEWIQPTGAQDAYNIDDKVSHNDKHWVSIANANVWEPGVYGWNEVVGE